MQASVQRPLRFGVAANSYRVPAWAAEGLRHLVESGHAAPVAFLQLRASRNGGSSTTQSGPLFRRYETSWLRRRARALQPVDLTNQLHSLVQIVGSATAEQTLEEPALDELRDLDLDFIWCLSDTGLCGSVLELPRFGIWQFQHNLEAAPFLWELLEGSARTRVALYRIGAAPGTNVCLHEGFFATCRSSWVNNLDRALLGSTDFCARACSELLANGSKHAERPDPENLHPGQRRVPRNRDLAYFLMKASSGLLERLWELSFHMEVWNVGFADSSVEQILRDGRIHHGTVRWCGQHKRDHFIADPFVYADAGNVRVLVEDYVQDKGRICTLTSAPGAEPPRAEPLGLSVDFEFPYHLSYPCIFCDNDKTYCVPEAYQSGRVTLYERSGKQWVEVRTLLEGQPVVDPTLFRYGDRYWLLYTLQNDGAWGNLKLYAHYADQLDAEWHPHALNPIKCDVGSSRPAGNVSWIDGELYRPSQDCSTTYGAAVVMNRIVKLTPTEFEEVAAARIEPIVSGPYPAGLHTLNAMGEHAVIDSKKFVFDPLAWRKNWPRRHEVFS